MPAQIAKKHGAELYDFWKSLDKEEQETFDNEHHFAYEWVKKNFEHLSHSAMTLAASIIVGDYFDLD